MDGGGRSGTSLRLRVRTWWEGLTLGTPRPARRIAGLAALGAGAGLGEAAVVMLVVALATGAAPVDLGMAEALGDGGLGAWRLAGLTIVVVAGLALVHVALARLTARTGIDAQRSVRALLVESYLGSSWRTRSGRRAGELQELVMSNANQIAHGAQQAANGLSSGVNLVVVVVAAVAVSPWTTVGLVFVGAVVVVVVRPFRRLVHQLSVGSARSSAELATEVAEMVSVSRELTTFAVTGAAVARLRARIDEAGALAERARAMTTMVPTLSRDLTVAALVVGLAAVVSRAEVPVPVLGASVVLLLRALGHAQAIASVSQQLSERAAVQTRLQRFLADWRPAGRRRPTTPCPPVTSVVLDELTFSYAGPGGPPALDGVSLELRRGELLGVVGRTGAGKTTLVGLLLGLLEPDAGAVRVDGVRLAEIDPDEWHRRVAYLPQEPRLITGTVADNIAFLRHIDATHLLACAHRAGLGPELERWPDGLGHHVGAAGADLSGGQRQRIALARALAGNPDVLVLDEPTSALDAHTEAAVRRAVSGLRGSVTVVLVAHRLSTLDVCDRIAVIDAGRLTSLGPPAELAADEGYYREVVALSQLRP